MCLLQLVVPLAAALFLFQLIGCSSAAPYGWREDHSGYDASLDPIAWSRAFVQDAIRKPRQFQSLALERNLFSDDDDDRQDLFRRLKSSRAGVSLKLGNNFEAAHRNFGKRGRKYVNYSWHDGASLLPAHLYRKSKAMLRKFYRQKYKLDDRDVYGLFDRKL